MLKNIKVLSLTLLIILSLLIVSILNENAYSQVPQNPLKLVAIGNSTPAGYGIKPQENYLRVYAEYIEQDLNVEVEIINWAKLESRNLLGWVQAITTDEVFRMDIKNADIITIWISGMRSCPISIKQSGYIKKN